MQRIAIEPRQNWTQKIEALGFDFYTSGGVPYWHESAYYQFTAAEIDTLEAAANKLHQLCLYAVDKIVSERLFPLLGIGPEIAQYITASWERKDPCIYGRFDLIYTGYDSTPKLLEYNADTPTSLFEASIVQWNWWTDRFPRMDQFNSIHESIQDRWRACLVGQRNTETLYVTTATPCPEDETTVQYLGQLAKDAGYKAVKFIPIQDIGWNNNTQEFRDLDERPIRHIFKLYPWEWLFKDSFGANILTATGMRWWEPPWKGLLSNKGILPILWEMFPEHPNLLPAYRDPTALKGQAVVRKPVLGREGCNVEIFDATGSSLAASDGPYGESGYIYQAYVEPPLFGTARPNLGVWMAGDAACGMGVREDDRLIVSNTSRFVPHLFE